MTDTNPPAAGESHADTRRVSLELSHSWPGEMYLRFGIGVSPAVMVGVTEADLAALRKLLGCSHENGV